MSQLPVRFYYHHHMLCERVEQHRKPVTGESFFILTWNDYIDAYEFSPVTVTDSIDWNKYDKSGDENTAKVRGYIDISCYEPFDNKKCWNDDAFFYTDFYMVKGKECLVDRCKCHDSIDQ